MPENVVIKIAGDAKAYSEALGEVHKETGDLEGQLGKLSKISGIAFAGLTASIGASVVAYAEAEKVQSRVNAIIKATGGAAGVTGDQVFDMATKLQAVTTFGDEAIATGTGILLTFRRIGGDVIPQATEAVLDLATHMGTDTTAAARLLGQALNDPIDGATRLKRAGIDLTEQQLDQMKAMIAAGDVAGAQRFILDQLKASMGGLAREAALTTSGAFIQLKETFGDVVEEIGKNFAPALTAAAKGLNSVFQYVKDHPQVTKLVAALAVGGTVVTGLGTAFGVAALAALKFRAAMIAANVATVSMRTAVRGLLAATGIGLLAVIAAEVALNWNTIWPRMQKVYVAFATSVGELTSRIGGLLGAAFRFDFAAMGVEFEKLKATLKKGYDDAFAAIPERQPDAGVTGSASIENAQKELVIETALKKQKEDEKQRLDEIAKAKELERVRQHTEMLRLEAEGASEQVVALTKQEGELKLALLEAHNEEERGLIQARFEQVQELLAEQREIEAEQRQVLRDEIFAQNDEFNALTEEQQRLYTERNQAALVSSIQTEKTTRKRFLDERLREQIASNNQHLQDTIRYNKVYADLNQFLRDSEIGRSATFFTSMQRLQQSNNAVLKTIGKAAALTQIAMDTARGATQALGAFPIPFIGPALGFAAAAAIVAFGIEQSARVVSAAEGGLMVGGRRGVDSIPTLTMPGELVAPTRNFDEVINGVARERIARGELPGVSADGRSDGSPTEVAVKVEIDLAGNASQLFTAKQIEDRALGISREAS